MLLSEILLEDTVSYREQIKREMFAEDDMDFFLAQARLASNFEDFCNRVIPSNLKASKPEDTYLVYRGDKPVAHISADRLDRWLASNRRAGQPEYTKIQLKKPSWQAKKKYETYSAIVAKMKEKYEYFYEQDLIGWHDIERCPYVIIKFIGNSIGAKRWRKPDPRLGTFEEGFGGGYELKLPDENIVFVGASFENGDVYMDQIAILKKSSGLGSKIMNALHSFCLERKCNLIVYKVTNPEFYKKFPWLEENKDKNFVFRGRQRDVS